MIDIYSHMNALGSCLSKKHEFIDPFKKDDKPVKKTPDQLKDELNNLINNWR